MRTETFRRLFPQLAGKRNARGVMIAADHAARLLRASVEDICKDGSLLADGLIRAQNLYQADFTTVFIDTALEAEALGARLEFSETKSPEVIESVDWRQLHYRDITGDGRIPEMFRAAEKCRAEFGDEFRLLFSIKDAFSLAGRVLPPEDFLESTIANPAKAHEALEICCHVQQTYLKAILSAGFTPMIGAPMASGDLIGPAIFRDFVEPYFQSLLDQISNAGKLRCVHICGDTSRFGPSLTRLRLDLFSFELWSPAVWEKLPATVPMGYVPTQLYASGTVKSIKDAAWECSQNLPEPYTLCSACDIPPNARPEFVQAMLK